MNNIFEDKSIITERVKLVEDIKLPESVSEYKNISAKFYFNLFTPLVDKSKVNSQFKSAPNINKYSNNSLSTSDYQQSNYITLIIPKYMLYQFDNIIPKDTEFIITCIGEFKIEHFRIIGIYTLEEE
jgi:hypothetical protein